MDARIVDVGLGNRHACALSDAHAVYCWGLNHQGQLGPGAIAEEAFLPAPVTGLTID